MPMISAFSHAPDNRILKDFGSINTILPALRRVNQNPAPKEFPYFDPYFASALIVDLPEQGAKCLTALSASMIPRNLGDATRYWDTANDSGAAMGFLYRLTVMRNVTQDLSLLFDPIFPAYFETEYGGGYQVAPGWYGDQFDYSAEDVVFDVLIKAIGASHFPLGSLSFDNGERVTVVLTPVYSIFNSIYQQNVAYPYVFSPMYGLYVGMRAENGEPPPIQPPTLVAWRTLSVMGCR